MVLGSRRVCKPEQHPRRIILELLVDEALEFSEHDDLIEPLCGAALREPRSVPLIRTLSRASSSGLKPTPSSMKGEAARTRARYRDPVDRCRL